jgi:hypothetical protein
MTVDIRETRNEATLVLVKDSPVPVRRFCFDKMEAIVLSS